MRNTIDLSQLPAPEIIAQVDYERILDDALVDYQERYPEFSAVVESEPILKFLEVLAYRTMLTMQRVNDACRGVMLAYAIGPDLDQLGALFGVDRNIIDPGDPNAIPPVPVIMEDDTDYRYRIQLSLEGLATTGPRGAYIFHTLSVPDVLDASVYEPADQPGVVVISVLSYADDGVPSAATLEAVEAALNDEDVRPLGDQVVVQPVEMVDYTVEATIYTNSGPDPETVIAASRSAMEALAGARRRIGTDIAISGIYAALHQPGVARVELTTPTADISIADTQAGRCTSITLVNGNGGGTP